MNMDFLGSLLLAFSMYSALPVPNVRWNDRRMRYAMCFFPLASVKVCSEYPSKYR